MPHRSLIHNFMEQAWVMGCYMLGSSITALAAANIDLMSAAPINGNQFLLVVVAGALCGSVLAVFVMRSTAKTPRVWAARMFFSTITSVVFTPFFLQLACKVDVTIFGMQVQLVPNAAVTLAFSAMVALGFKAVIRAAHDRWEALLHPDDGE